MGNICSSHNNNKVTQPPGNLAGLLEQSMGKDAEIVGPWGKLFMQFLRHGNQTDLEHSLAFYILAARLKAIQGSLTQGPQARVQKELQETRITLIHRIASSHLTVNAPQPVALTNQVLREELAACLPKISIKSSEKEISTAVEDIWNNPDLWMRLDSAYTTFQANKTSPSVSQVLLSML